MVEIENGDSFARWVSETSVPVWQLNIRSVLRFLPVWNDRIDAVKLFEVDWRKDCVLPYFDISFSGRHGIGISLDDYKYYLGENPIFKGDDVEFSDTHNRVLIGIGDIYGRRIYRHDYMLMIRNFPFGANFEKLSVSESVQFWHAISLDATALESGVDLWSQPLWLDDIPNWAAEGWENLATELTKRTPYWKTLVRWYEDRLRGDDWAASQGRPAIPELEIARASLPESYWKKGGKAVNLAIAELEDFFWNNVPLKDPALRELVKGLGVITDSEDVASEIEDDVPAPVPELPPVELPPQTPRAFQFAAPPGGPIDLALILPEDVLSDAPDRRDDFAELLFKAQELAGEGPNRLGRVGVPIERLLALGDDLSRIRAKLLWSRINTLRIVLQGHVAAAEGETRGGEPDERLLDGVIADKLTDIVQTANIFVSGDANLLELDARRSGPQELTAAKQEVAIIAPLVAKVASDRVMTAVLSGEVIKEQVENVSAAEDTLAGRQAAELGAKTSRNFFSVLLSLGRREALDGGKDIKSGVYRAVGARAFDAAIQYGPHASLVFASFIAQNAEALTQYVQIAFNNVDIERLIQMIASLF